MRTRLRFIGLSIILLAFAGCSAGKEEWTKYFGEIRIVLDQQEKAMKDFEKSFSDLRGNRYLDANEKVKLVNDVVSQIGVLQEKIADFQSQLEEISNPGDDRGLLESIKNLMAKQKEFADLFKSNFEVVAESMSAAMDLQMKAERREEVSEDAMVSLQNKGQEAMANIENFDTSSLSDLIEKCTVAQDKFFNQTGIESEKIDFSKFK